jgi:hypothetical protein
MASPLPDICLADTTLTVSIAQLRFVDGICAARAVFFLCYPNRSLLIPKRPLCCRRAKSKEVSQIKVHAFTNSFLVSPIALENYLRSEMVSPSALLGHSKRTLILFKGRETVPRRGRIWVPRTCGLFHGCGDQDRCTQP